MGFLEIKTVFIGSKEISFYLFVIYKINVWITSPSDCVSYQPIAEIDCAGKQNCFVPFV